MVICLLTCFAYLLACNHCLLSMLMRLRRSRQSCPWGGAEGPRLYAHGPDMPASPQSKAEVARYLGFHVRETRRLPETSADLRLEFLEGDHDRLCSPTLKRGIREHRSLQNLRLRLAMRSSSDSSHCHPHVLINYGHTWVSGWELYIPVRVVGISSWVIMQPPHTKLLRWGYVGA